MNQPIHDIDVQIKGPAVADVHHFVNELWSFVCKWQNSDMFIFSDSYIKGKYGNACENNPKFSRAKGKGGIPMLSLGRLGTGMFPGNEQPANQSEIGRNLFLNAAKKSIKISQQNIGSEVLDSIYWPLTNPAGNEVSILATKPLQEVDVYIVVTNYGAKDAAGKSYSSGVTLSELANKLFNEARKANRKLKKPYSKKQLINKLCQRLHIAPLRFSKDQTWPSGDPFGNHAKIWIIDDKLFYIGSHNMYTANLQEFGYVIADPKTTGEFLSQYWNNLWRYSSQEAISGSEATKCYYRNVK